MRLTYRPARSDDFPACLAMLRNRLAYRDDLLTHLPGIWRRLQRGGALVSAVVEDGERRDEARIVAFGMSVFTTEGFMAEARRAAEPYLTARVIRDELRGKSPILRPPGIRAANSNAGLNLLVLHYGEATAGLSAADRYLVRHKMLEAFLRAHRGYRLTEVLQEFWDEIDLCYVLQGWGRVRSDYADYFRRRGLRPPPPARRPHLVGLTRDEALVAPGSLAAPLFVYTPPRFFFPPGEQRLLARALAGETDAELARSLCVAIPTVKSRWRAVYDRVTAVAPELCRDPSATVDAGLRRGKEKRRRLLEYLREHPEELRPAMGPPRGSGALARRRRGRTALRCGAPAEAFGDI